MTTLVSLTFTATIVTNHACLSWSSCEISHSKIEGSMSAGVSYDHMNTSELVVQIRYFLTQKPLKCEKTIL